METRHSKKRKVEANVLDLPQVWGKILECLMFEDVRSALLLSRMIAIEAAKYVEIISIAHPRHLDARLAHRFPNVKTLYVWCLMEYLPEDSDDDQNTTLNQDAIGRIVPFMTSFPMLKKCNTGGEFGSDGWYEYDVHDCTNPRNHNEMFRGLIRAFCGAFDSHDLSQSLNLRGIIGYHSKFRCEPRVETADSPCSLCRHICNSFPLEALIRTYGRHRTILRNDMCIQDDELCSIIKNRKWKGETIALASKRSLIDYDLLRLWTITVTNYPKFRQIADDLKKVGAAKHEEIHFLHHLNLQRLKMLLNLGCSISDCGLTSKRLMGIMQTSSGEDLSSGGYALLKSTFDGLSAMGYPINEQNFVIVDEKEYPELTKLLKKFGA